MGEKLRNWDACTGKHHIVAGATPQNLDCLPEGSARPHAGSENNEPENDTQCEDLSEEELFGGRDEEGMHLEGDTPVLPLRPQHPLGTPRPVDIPCGTLPDGTTLDDFHRPPARIHARSAELLYWRSFSDADILSQPPAASDGELVYPTQPWELSAADALDAALLQTTFFKIVDNKRVDAPGQDPELSDIDMPDTTAQGTTTPRGSAKRDTVVWGQTTHQEPKPAVNSDELDNDAKLQLALDQTLIDFNECMPKAKYVKSPSIVLEAACHLLVHGALNIPDVCCINVKQARALLWNAVWLQEHMNEQWREKEWSTTNIASACEASLVNNFTLAIMGPGGTGKTAVLKAIEPLTIFFKGADTVRKMAPSNAAARLLGGDTLHACCKLPFGKTTLTSRKGTTQGCCAEPTSRALAYSCCRIF